jgi:hypothetical protein
MTPELIILIPVLRRPHRVKPLLESIETATPKGCYRVLFLLSPMDAAELVAVVQGAEGRSWVNWYVMDRHLEGGDFQRKINEGYRGSKEPLIFAGADDLCFHPGWFEAAKRCLRPGIGMIGTNDLGNPGVLREELSTHSLFTRAYADLGTVDQPRTIYCELYPHTRCDNEAVETAMARQAYCHAADSIVEHLHPHWGKASLDSVYTQAYSPANLRAGNKIFHERRPLWQNLPKFEG